MRTTNTIVVSIALLVAACGHPFKLREAETAYDYGHYNETVAMLEPFVNDPGALSFNAGGDDDRLTVRLSTYLGLAHDKLGHRALALSALKQADQLYRAGTYDALPLPIVKEMGGALADLQKNPPK